MGHIPQKYAEHFFCDQTIITVGDHTLSNGTRGIGHNADNGQGSAGKAFDLRKGKTCRHRDQYGLFLSENGLQRRQNTCHHLGFYP